MEIQIRNISKSYGRQAILRGVSLTAGAGEVIGIMGLNGSGKSTLLGILAGIIAASGGEFLLDGRDMLHSAGLRQLSVGYVPQGTPLMEDLTAYDNLRLYYRRAALAEAARDGIIARLGVTEFIKKPVSQLSGGMKKRLSIACAMANDPPIIIMDEPTAALDIAGRHEIADYMKMCREQGKCLLLATHEAAEAALCDRLYLLRDGVLQEFAYDGDEGKLAAMLWG